MQLNIPLTIFRRLPILITRYPLLALRRSLRPVDARASRVYSEVRLGFEPPLRPFRRKP